MSVVSCRLLVGAKHLEDKLSIIAKNSSPNASPVQLSVVSCRLLVANKKQVTTDSYQLLIYVPNAKCSTEIAYF
ncbi:hypothetical protein [Anabaena sp. AL09]|uniref:hypothetical protein n=1 Tax=Anabaena sp. AL09 TaxID=1710891 RepID=UPI000B044C09|nr:hypothetical protein [Anabaena sp. AL09]